MSNCSLYVTLVDLRSSRSGLLQIENELKFNLNVSNTIIKIVTAKIANCSFFNLVAVAFLLFLLKNIQIQELIYFVCHHIFRVVLNLDV